MTYVLATGGVSYRMLRDERTMGSIITLAMICARSKTHAYAGHTSRHSSNIWTGRAQWLRELIFERQIDFAIGLDSDTGFDATMLLAELARVGAVNVAIGLCPVRVGGTEECNLSYDHPTGVRRIRYSGLAELLKSESREIHSGGFGVAVYNLAWYREHWPLPAPERIEFGMGEDTEHCLAVRKRGGKVIALNVQTQHFAWDEGQIRVVRK